MLKKFGKKNSDEIVILKIIVVFKLKKHSNCCSNFHYICGEEHFAFDSRVEEYFVHEARESSVA